MRNQTIVVDINKEICKILRYKQYDNNNLLQIIVEENYKKVNLENYEGVALFQLPSGMIIKKDCEIQENVITIVIDNNILNEDGAVALDLTLSDGEETFTLFRITLTVEKSIDKDEAIIVNAGWDITAEILKFKIDEAQRQADEAQRLVKEEQRLKEEIDRQDEEIKRKANETQRLINEEQRISKENKRLADEELRTINENKRLEKEEQRLNDEQKRISTEEIRLRKEIERLQSETDRNNSEMLRAERELERIEQERQRLINEEIRESNEKRRQEVLKEADVDKLINTSIRLDNVEDELVEVNSQLTHIEKKTSGYVNILEFGADNKGEIDNTEIFKKAIKQSKKIYIPNGIYLVNNIELISNINIEGESKETIIKAIEGSNSKGVFTLEKNNPVQNVYIRNLTIKGNNNTDQYGMFFEATPTIDPPYHGGLWNSKFDFIDIVGFSFGLGLFAKSNGLLPIQGLQFDRCEFKTDSNVREDGVACMIEGQTEQILFNQCAFSGNHTAKSSSLKMRRERSVDGSVVGDSGSHSKTFNQCYFGNTLYGVTMERTTDTRFNNCFFENSCRCITLSTACESIIVDGCNFYECGRDIAGTGYLIKGDTDDSYLTFTNNRSIGSTRLFKEGYLNLTSYNNKLSNITVSNAWYDCVVTNNRLDIKSKYLRLNNNQDLKHIVSTFTHGDEIIIHPFVGDVNILSGGNIKCNEVLKKDMYYKFTLIGDTWIRVL